MNYLTAPKKPKICLRFIDDIFLIWRHGKEELDRFVTMIKSYHPTIKFSVTVDYNNAPFWDTIVYRGIKLLAN